MGALLWGIAALAAIAFGVWLWQNRGGGGNVMPIPAGQKTQVTPPCGQPFLIGPFRGRPIPGGWGRRGHAQVLIYVKSACGAQEAEIEVEQKQAGNWETLRERVNAGRDDKPQVGSWYAVPVPDGRRIRLTCPGGDGRCEFEVTDITNPANLTFNITPNPLAPACGARAIPRLLNLSRDNLAVVVTFDSLCTNNAGLAQPGLIHKVAIRPVGPAPPTPVRDPIPAPGQADIPVQPAAAGNPTVWNSGLEAGYALEASCSGTRGGCSIRIQVRG